MHRDERIHPKRALCFIHTSGRQELFTNDIECSATTQQYSFHHFSNFIRVARWHNHYLMTVYNLTYCLTDMPAGNGKSFAMTVVFWHTAGDNLSLILRPLWAGGLSTEITTRTHTTIRWPITKEYCICRRIEPHCHQVVMCSNTADTNNE